MVKNLGGNKGKKVSRKNMNVPYTGSIRKKNPLEPCEMYAMVNKLTGGSMFEAKCEDGVTRICIIRNKFRGRGKRDNMLTAGIWVLIGTRDWEVKHPDKKSTCDLLYVYSEEDKTTLKTNTDGHWSVLKLDGEEDDTTTSTGIDMDYNSSNANEVAEATLPLEVWIEEDAIDINDI
jgi:translation initiation factor IF-1